MFTLKSPVFQDGGKIPEKYTEGSKISPPLSWADLPKGTKSLALAITDLMFQKRSDSLVFLFTGWFMTFLVGNKSC